jgi:hypothetical protein
VLRHQRRVEGAPGGLGDRHRGGRGEGGPVDAGVVCGWHIGSPTPGDVDGDGLNEIVIISREGKLFVWDTPAPTTEAGLPWQGFGRDRRNTKNGQSGVSNLASSVDPLAGLGWELEQILADIQTLVGQLAPPDSTLLAGSPAPFLIPLALGHIQRSSEFGVSKTLKGIEFGLRLPSHPIPGLEPLHARFLEAVRATLVREVEATTCAPADIPCKHKLMLADFVLEVGDNQLPHDPRTASHVWAIGIGRF